MRWQWPWPVTRPVVMATLAVVAVFVLLDFFLRIFVGRGAELRPYQAPVAAAAPAPFDAKAASERLESWLPKAAAKEDIIQERTLALTGVFRSGGSVRATIFLEPSGSLRGQYVLVSRGDEVDGWRVERIEARRVSLSKGDQVRELEMFKMKQGAKTP